MNDEAAVVEGTRKATGGLIVLGVITVILGLLAIGCPLVTGIAIGILVGAFLLVGGIVQVVHVFNAHGWKDGFLYLVSGVLSAICGGIMLAHPVFGLGVLTIVLIFYFLLDGITKIIFSFKMRPAKGWGWILFSGLVTLALALLIWRQWPLSGAWAVGLLVGINLLFDGWAMILTGGTVRSMVAK